QSLDAACVAVRDGRRRCRDRAAPADAGDLAAGATGARLSGRRLDARRLQRAARRDRRPDAAVRGSTFVVRLRRRDASAGVAGRRRLLALHDRAGHGDAGGDPSVPEGAVMLAAIGPRRLLGIAAPMALWALHFVT